MQKPKNHLDIYKRLTIAILGIAAITWPLVWVSFENPSSESIACNLNPNDCSVYGALEDNIFLGSLLVGSILLAWQLALLTPPKKRVVAFIALAVIIAILVNYAFFVIGFGRLIDPAA
jgi:hypothetical protein